MLNWDDPLGKPKTTPKPTTIPSTPSQSEEQLVAESTSIYTTTQNENITAKAPVNASEKRVVNGLTDVNQLAPFKYPWAWDFFLNANKNHWTPLDVNMTQDVHDFQHSLTDDERHVYTNVLAYLTTSDILAMRNIGLAVMEKMTAPELQIYQARQVYEEALHCYREGTEVLTNKGFVDFRAINAGTLIAQYHEDGSISFVKHLGITIDDFAGELVEFSSSVYQTQVTPNHRCVYFDTRNDNKLEIAQAEDLSASNKNFPVAGKLTGERNTLSIQERMQLAYQADGTISNDGAVTKDGMIMYRWHFHKAQKKRQLLALLEEGKFGYTDNDDYIYVWIPEDQALSKNFDWVDLSQLSHQYADDFIANLMLWDGSTSSDMRRYCSTNKACINIATAMGTLAGYRVGCHETETSTGTPYYTLNFIDRDYVSGRSLEKSHIAYTGKVYSVGVPTTMIITRFNHKVCVSGNTWTYQHCIETIGLDQGEIYNRYRVVPAINQKIEVANRRLNSILRPNIDLNDPDELNNFVMAYMFFAAIFEGCWFYNGFSPIFALQRRGLMKGTAEQLQYIMRDEVMHASFGLRVVKQIILENNVTLDPQLIREMWDEAEAAESGYAHYILQKPILGYSAEEHIEQFRFIANRRARNLSLEEPFPGAKDTLPWLDEQANLRKEKNFFETRVTEYQTGGGLDWG
jgi:ribonucleotide reductase beta subunit family protein with ferritin-like domain